MALPPNICMATENKYVLINHGRIYDAPLNGPNPEGMTAWFDRRVFAEKGYKVTGCFSTYNIECVKLNPDDPHDLMMIRMQEEMDRIVHMHDASDESDEDN